MFFQRSSPDTKILMVCMGNVCRSPMAQAIAIDMADKAGIGTVLQVDSAGTQAMRNKQPPDPRALAALAERGYAAGKTRSRQITEQDFARYTLILAMDRDNLNSLRRICPNEHSHKMRLLLEFAPGADTLDIPDPFYGNPEGFARVMDLCESGARGLIAELRATLA